MAGGQGTWPAVWLLGADCQTVNPTDVADLPCQWPKPGSNEIDLAEIMNGDLRTVTQTVVYPDVYPFQSVSCYPNPFRASRGDPSMTFDRMPANSTVKIFTISGRWVTTLDAPAGEVSWKLTNSAGDPVASGIYFYLVTDAQGNQTRGKFTVIK